MIHRLDFEDRWSPYAVELFGVHQRQKRNHFYGKCLVTVSWVVVITCMFKVLTAGWA